MLWLLLLADFIYILKAKSLPLVDQVPAILFLPRFFQNSANSEDYSKLKILYREAPKMSALKRQIFFQLTSADLTF